MTKRNICFLCILALIPMFFIFSLVREGVPSCPAPTDLESMEVYQFLNEAVREDTTPEEAIEAFARMCEMPVDCLDDQILFEYRYSDYSGNFYIHLARQFQFCDSAEYVQLHLDLTFPTGKMQDFPKSCNWYVTSRTDVRKLLSESEGFQSVDGILPSYTGVAIDWTW